MKLEDAGLPSTRKSRKRMKSINADLAVEVPGVTLPPRDTDEDQMGIASRIYIA